LNILSSGTAFVAWREEIYINRPLFPDWPGTVTVFAEIGFGGQVRFCESHRGNSLIGKPTSVPKCIGGLKCSKYRGLDTTARPCGCLSVDIHAFMAKKGRAAANFPTLNKACSQPQCGRVSESPEKDTRFEY
jgi:hypothetical protein